MVWGCSSAGEHFVDIEGVTGSIPVTPTIFSKRFLKQSVRFDAFLLSGLVVIDGNMVWINRETEANMEPYSDPED